jgi:aminoglycoside 6'-N-acetyltransferase I
MHVRAARQGDDEAIVALRGALWPDCGPEEQRAEVAAILAGRPRSTLPLVIVVAEVEGRVVGFAEAGLRSHADGCDPTRPCGFLEGLYVVPEQRRAGVARALVEWVEGWARGQGCAELASDTWADNAGSIATHGRLGFEVVDRCVNFRKALGDAVGSGEGAGGQRSAGYYGETLARLHDDHFGHLAEAAARELLGRLDRAGFMGGTVVDLGTGSGRLAKVVGEAGYDVVGIDVSPAMLALARRNAPRARLVEGSVWSTEVPEAVAIAAVGEVFNYAGDGALPTRARLEARLGELAARLVPGGVLLFDLAGPGRSGPSGARNVVWSGEEGMIAVREREEEARRGEAPRLLREIDVFTLYRGCIGGDPEARYVRERETQCLALFEPERVMALLARSGLERETTREYAGYPFGREGWTGFVGRKMS